MNTQIKTRQGRRVAQAALRSCGSFEQRRDLRNYPTFISLNAELVACRTSRQRELASSKRREINSDRQTNELSMTLGRGLLLLGFACLRLGDYRPPIKADQNASNQWRAGFVFLWRPTATPRSAHFAPVGRGKQSLQRSVLQSSGIALPFRR